MVDGVSGTTDKTDTTNANTKPQASNSSDALANKDTFLELLVAQIRNQDPLQPSDGIQFVSQLAQFSGLEQTMELRQDVESIQQILEQQAANSSQAAGSAEKS
jgi:flagellar basal-body rod modification protein FlgD